MKGIYFTIKSAC